MNKRIIKVLPLVLLSAFVIAQCGGGGGGGGGGDSGFNPPDRSVSQPTGTVTVEGLIPQVTEPIVLIPLTTPTLAGTQASTQDVISGQVLVNNRCTVCHSIARIEGSHKSPEEWKATVARMIGKGAVLDATEEQAVLDYLIQAFPKQ